MAECERVRRPEAVSPPGNKHRVAVITTWARFGFCSRNHTFGKRPQTELLLLLLFALIGYYCVTKSLRYFSNRMCRIHRRNMNSVATNKSEKRVVDAHRSASSLLHDNNIIVSRYCYYYITRRRRDTNTPVITLAVSNRIHVEKSQYYCALLLSRALLYCASSPFCVGNTRGNGIEGILNAPNRLICDER